MARKTTRRRWTAPKTAAVPQNDIGPEAEQPLASRTPPISEMIPDGTESPDAGAELNALLDGGLSFPEAVAVLAKRHGAAVAAPESIQDRMLRGDSFEAFHDDAERVYAERMANYAPPVLQQDLTFTLQARHYGWLERRAIMESAIRGREVTVENMAEIIIREACAADPTKGGILNSGKAGEFNAVAGSWG